MVTTRLFKKRFIFNAFAFIVAFLFILGAHIAKDSWSASCSIFDGNYNSCISTGCSWPYSGGTGYCSDFNNNQSACEGASGCSYPGDSGSCSDFNNQSGVCNATAGCSYPGDLGSCSIFNGNQASCQGTLGCSYPGNLGSCSDFNNQSFVCNATAGCSYPGDTEDCGGFSDEGQCGAQTGCILNYDSCGNFSDEMTCTFYAGCSWNGASCDGSYFSSCTGSYDTGECVGNYDDGSCTGSYDDGLCIGNYNTGECAGTYNPNVCVGTYDNTAPTIVSAEVNGATLVLTYDEPLNESSTPPTSDFAVSENAFSIYLNQVTISGSTVTLTLASAVDYNTTVTVSYTAYSTAIEDTSGNDADSLSGYTVTNNTSNNPPTILDITSEKPDGTYTTGDIIDIDITFSETVSSTGVVTVTLETGDTDRTCTFTVSNSTTGTCDYTVQDGDSSLDLTVSSVSGSITDIYSLAMSNFNPAVNLAENKELIIDTSDLDPPTLVSFSPDDTDFGYEDIIVGDLVIIEMVFNENVQADTGIVYIKKHNDDSTVAEIDISDFTGFGDDTIFYTFDSSELEDSTLYYVQIGSGVIVDATAGNPFAGISDKQVWNFSTNDNAPASSGSGGSGGGRSSSLDVSCDVSDTTPQVGDGVEFTVDVDTDSSYTFSWTSVLSGRNEEAMYTFNEPGTYYPRGQVRTSNGVTAVTCGTITVSDEVSTISEEKATTTVAIDAIDRTDTFLYDRSLGDMAPDIQLLQQILNKLGFTLAAEGPGAPGQETTYFGLRTQAALIQWQQWFGIVPANGVFGERTRMFANFLRVLEQAGLWK